MSQGSTTGTVSIIQVIDAIPTDGSNNPVSSNGTFDALALKANLASPTFTGTPTAPTPSASDNSTKIATTAYVDTADALKLNVASPSYTGLMTGVGTAQTGSFAIGVLDLSQTWNTSGNPIAIKLNVTNTASGASANLMDLQVGGVSQFKVSKAGAITTPNGITASGFIGNSILQSSDFTPLDIRGKANTGGAGMSSVRINPAQAQNNTSGTVITLDMSVNNVFNPTSGTATYTTLNLAPTINQTGGANGISRALYINPTITAAADFRALEVAAGKLMFSTTITAPGTTGAQTINKISGKVNAAAGTTSLVVTNNLVTASSIVICQMGTNDATARITSSVEAAGSFTINYVAPTAETVIKFFVIN